MALKPTISVAMIVKNEAHNLDAFFESIAPVVDELVVGYSHSTDTTLAKLQEWKAKAPYPVTIFELNINPFHWGQARNKTIERATGDFIFILDGDERLTPDTCPRLKDFLAQKDPSAVVMQRQDDMVPHLIDPQIRVIKNHNNIYYQSDEAGQTDEQLILPNPPIPFGGSILHLQGEKHWLREPSFRLNLGLRQNIDKIPNTHGFLRECTRGFIGFFYKFRKIYFYREAYRDGWNGFRYAFLRGWYFIMLHFAIGLKPRATPDTAKNH